MIGASCNGASCTGASCTGAGCTGASCQHYKGMAQDAVLPRMNSEMYGMMEERRVVRLVRKIIEEERSEGEEEEDCEGIGDEKAIV